MSEDRTGERNREGKSTVFYLLAGLVSLLVLPIVGPFLIMSDRYRTAQRFAFLPGIAEHGGLQSALVAMVYLVVLYSLVASVGAVATGQIGSPGGDSVPDGSNNTTQLTSTPTPTAISTTPRPTKTNTPTPTPANEEPFGLVEKRQIESFGTDFANALNEDKEYFEKVDATRQGKELHVNYTYQDGENRASKKVYMADSYANAVENYRTEDPTYRLPDRVTFKATNPDGSWAHDGYIEGTWADAHINDELTRGAYGYSFLSTTTIGGPTVGVADNGSVESREEKLEVTEDRMRHRIQENMSVHKLRSVSHNDSYLKVSYTVASKGRSAGVVSSNFSIQYAVHSGLYGPDYLPSEGVEVTTFTPDGELYTRYYVYNNKSIGHYSGYISGSQYFLDVQGTVSFFQEPR